MSKFEIDMDEQFVNILEYLAYRPGAYDKHAAMGEVILNAVATYKFLKDEVKAPGRKVSITNTKDEVIKDIELP